MNRIIVRLVFVFAFLPETIICQQRGFEINGHLDGMADGEIVKLGQRFDDFHFFTVIDSCKVSHGNFHLKSSLVPEGPRLYEILFNSGTHRHFDAGKNRNEGGVICTLFIDNGDKITIHGGDINEVRNGDFSSEIVIEGSISNTARLPLIPMEFLFKQFYGFASQQMAFIKDSIGFNPALAGSLIESKAMLDKILGALATYNDFHYLKPALPLFTTFSLDNYHGSFLPDLYASLDTQARNSYYGRILKGNAALAIGQPFPLFTLPTVDKKMIALKDILGKGKVTLVHLWASNSVDKEQYQKELRFLYGKYHSKGLNVIGVSADSIEHEWKKWLMVEEFPWDNVSDLKGNMKGGIVQDLYHEGGHRIPNTTNILLDAQGRIIAWDVSGPELQWYLWKLLGD